MRAFGHVPGNPVSTSYADRRALYEAQVHAPIQTGIWGTGTTGAVSIIVSGGYEDDEDYGSVIVYTGQGGRDATTGQQVADQAFVRGNAGLVRSCVEGLPVRVIRGARAHTQFSPATGFRYDGLFRVESYWQERGRSGFLVCRFRLVELDNNEPGEQPTEAQTAAVAAGPAPRAEVTSQRIIRSSAAVRGVKELHVYVCQVCGEVIETDDGIRYAEGAHIRPLGRPHDGPDVANNILCLCPNDHVRFDLGVLTVDDDMTIRRVKDGSIVGVLRLAEGLSPDRGQLAYHRSLFQG
jgi:putative restriction endonuclease